LAGKKITFEQREHYLFVSSESADTDFASVVEVTVKINERVGESPTPYALLDFRKVRFKLPKANAFDLIRIYESRMANYKSATMAVIVNSEDLEIAELWKEVSQKRGFRFMTFTDLGEGEKWLLRQKGI